MTRRSKREVARALDGIDEERGNQDDMICVVYRDDRTGDLVDEDGEPTEVDGDALMVIIHDTVVTSRERAEEQGCEVLGPAEDVPQDDAVQVVWGK